MFVSYPEVKVTDSAGTALLLQDLGALKATKPFTFAVLLVKISVTRCQDLWKYNVQSLTSGLCRSELTGQERPLSVFASVIEIQKQSECVCAFRNPRRKLKGYFPGASTATLQSWKLLVGWKLKTKSTLARSNTMTLSSSCLALIKAQRIKGTFHHEQSHSSSFDPEQTLASVVYAFSNRLQQGFNFPHGHRRTGLASSMHTLSGLDSSLSPVERATVNVSLAEIINVTTPPYFQQLSPPPPQANFRAAYSQLNEKISTSALYWQSRQRSKKPDVCVDSGSSRSYLSKVRTLHATGFVMVYLKTVRLLSRRFLQF